MQESGRRENTWLRTMGAALPVLLLLLAVPALGWFGDRLKDSTREQQIASSEILSAAQELRALTAELAAWQLASALDFERGANYALQDGGFNRRQFLQKAESLRERFMLSEPNKALSDADPADLRLLRLQLDELLRLDRRAMEVFAAADASQGRHVTEAVLSGAHSLMDSLVGGMDQLVSVRALRSREQALTTERSARLGQQLQAGSLVLALMLGTLFITMLRRWMRLSQAYVAQLGRLTMRDEVSGALNRRAWAQRATEAFAQAARMGYPLTVAIVDIDRFGCFNVDYGRAAGDSLLMELAGRMRGHLRAQDLLARIEGGRFAVLLIDSHPAGARVKLQELRGDMPPQQTFSAGLASWNGAESPEELLARVGLALERAKLQGSNLTVTAPSPECLGPDAYRQWLQPVGSSSD